MARLLLHHVALGQRMQLLVNKRHKLVQRAPVSLAPAAEQRRHIIAGRGHLSIASISPPEQMGFVGPVGRSRWTSYPEIPKKNCSCDRFLAQSACEKVT